MATDDLRHIIETPTEESCVINAGPGSGKTWILIERLKYLLTRELRPYAGVAVITYTNAAADEIRQRLPSGMTPLFVETIHSFLLQYILYPYGYLIESLPKDFDLVTEGYAKQHIHWMTQNGHLNKKKAWISGVDKQFESIGHSVDGTLIGLGQSHLTQAEMQAFVGRMHEKGQISQNDVLWFSHVLLTSPHCSHILEALSCRFASILVDEFQDTTEIQFEILELLRKQGRTSLLLVGDKEQSIFGFAGASPSTFEACISSFTSHNLFTNRRSTTNIVKWLDALQNDKDMFKASADWCDEPIPVYILVGQVDNGRRLAQFYHLCNQHNLNILNVIDGYFILGRGHSLIKVLTMLHDGESVYQPDFLNELESKHRQLYSIMKKLLQACKCKQKQELAQAYRLLDQSLSRLVFKGNAGFIDTTEVGLTSESWRLVVISVLHEIDVASDIDIRDWVKGFKDIVADKVVASGGKKCRAKLRLLDSLEKNIPNGSKFPLAKCIQAVGLPDEMGENVRTIHTAKGHERNAVLVVANQQRQFTQWVKRGGPSSKRNEDSRIGYVAFSRARKLLCIATDGMNASTRKWIETCDFVKIVELGTA